MARWIDSRRPRAKILMVSIAFAFALATPRTGAAAAVRTPMRCLLDETSGHLDVELKNQGCFGGSTDDVALAWTPTDATVTHRGTTRTVTTRDMRATLRAIAEAIESPDDGDHGCTTNLTASLTWTCGGKAPASASVIESDCGGHGHPEATGQAHRVHDALEGLGGLTLRTTARDGVRERDESTRTLLTKTESIRREYVEVDPATHVRDTKLSSSMAAAGERFGASVAIDGDRMVVGQSTSGAKFEGSRVVYMFERDAGTWHERARLAADAGEDSIGFGAAVAISGDVVAVGDPYAGPDSGAVFVFAKSGTSWTKVARLASPAPSPRSQFGMSVALADRTLVVGAYGANRAFVFERTEDGWSNVTALVGDDTHERDMFGNAVAVSGDTILVGARFADPAGAENAGSAYVFERDPRGWHQTARLVPDDAKKRAGFGEEVALDGAFAVITAATFGGPYVYQRYADGSWRGDTLPLPVGATSRPKRVAVAGDRVAAATSTPWSREAVSPVAWTYTRRADEWALETTLAASDVGIATRGEVGLALDGATVVVGTPGAHLPRLLEAGSVHAFDLPGGMTSRRPTHSPMSSIAPVPRSGMPKSRGRIVAGAGLGTILVGGAVAWAVMRRRKRAIA